MNILERLIFTQDTPTDLTEQFTGLGVIDPNSGHFLAPFTEESATPTDAPATVTVPLPDPPDASPFTAATLLQAFYDELVAVKQLTGLMSQILGQKVDVATLANTIATILNAGHPNGVAQLGVDGKVLSDQLPAAGDPGSMIGQNVQAILTALQSQPNGLATLDANGVVPAQQLPPVLNVVSIANTQIYAKRGAVNGIAALGPDQKVPAGQLPAYVDDIVEANTLADFPVTGLRNKIYVDLATGKTYRWGATQYTEISASPGSTDAVPEGAVNRYFTLQRAAAAAPVQNVAGKNGAVVLNGADVGLPNVRNVASYSQAEVDIQLNQLNAQRGAANGVATLGADSKVKPEQLPAPVDAASIADARISAQRGMANGLATLGPDNRVIAAQLPAHVDDIIEATTLADFPNAGQSNKIYVDLTTGKTYRWGGSQYTEISASPGSSDAIPEGGVNHYFTVQRAADAAPVQSVAGRSGAVVLGKADVGLPNVLNVSSYSKSESDAQINQVNAQRGAANGLAPLGADQRVPAAFLPAHVDDIIEGANLAAFPAGGQSNKIYVDLSTGKTYRWGGSQYTEISASPGTSDAVPEGAVNRYFTVQRAADASPVQSVAGRSGAVVLSGADVGLPNVRNVASYSQTEVDAVKPDFKVVTTFEEAKTFVAANKPKIFFITNDEDYGTSLTYWNGTGYSVTPCLARS